MEMIEEIPLHPEYAELKVVCGGTQWRYLTDIVSRGFVNPGDAMNYRGH